MSDNDSGEIGAFFAGFLAHFIGLGAFDDYAADGLRGDQNFKDAGSPQIACASTEIAPGTDNEFRAFFPHFFFISFTLLRGYFDGT